jgi:colicin import membrane protein
MSAAKESKGPAGAPPNGEGVLAKLPRTRPQRASARRTAAREAASSNGAVKLEQAPSAKRAARSRKAAGAGAPTGASAPAPKPAKAATKAAATRRAGIAGRRGASAQTRTQAAAKPRTQSAAKARRQSASEARRESVPRQGFECEGTGGTVQPPGSAELVGSAVELVGDLAKAGLSTGERLLKDVLSRLPLS